MYKESTDIKEKSETCGYEYDENMGEDMLCEGNDYYIQWHLGFVGAIKLELKKYAGHIQYETEHPLNKKTIVVDLLVVKKDDFKIEDDGIGAFLKKHNLFEYKGVGDVLEKNVFSKGLAYAHLYKSYETALDPRNWEDITLTFVRESKPEKLFKDLETGVFEKMKVVVEKNAPGVYYIHNVSVFTVQIIVLREIDFEEHPWLRALTRKLDRKHAGMLASYEKELVEKEDLENAEAVMEVAVRANLEAFKQIIEEEGHMGRAMLELMKPEIDKIVANAIKTKDKEIETRDKEIETMGQKIETKDQELKSKNEEIRKLKERIAKLQGTAML